MSLNYGPRGEPLFGDGRPLWYGLKGETLTNEEAERLLRDRRRVIKKTHLKSGRTRIAVSTVFLVLDHGFMSPEPVLWETMVFGGSEDGVQMRYTTREAAKQGHAGLVGMLKMVVAIEQEDRARRRRLHSAYRARWA